MDNANKDMESWVREPQPSVFKHTFRDRQPDAEIGPANGHVSARKYVPRCSDERIVQLSFDRWGEVYRITHNRRGHRAGMLHDDSKNR